MSSTRFSRMNEFTILFPDLAAWGRYILYGGPKPEPAKHPNDTSALLERYAASRLALLSSFNFIDYFPDSIEDRTSDYWMIDDSQLFWADTKDELSQGNGYSSDIVGKVYRANGHAAMLTNQGVGVDDVLMVFSESKEIEGEQG